VTRVLSGGMEHGTRGGWRRVLSSTHLPLPATGSVPGDLISELESVQMLSRFDTSSPAICRGSLVVLTQCGAMKKLRIHLLLVLAAAGLCISCGSDHKSQNTPPASQFSAQDLQGSYVFTASGTDLSDGDYFVGGSFQADGKGNISSGIEDLNLGSGLDSGAQFTGTYIVDSGGNAVVSISDGTGVANFFNVALAKSGSSQITNYNGTGSGTLEPQNTSGFSNMGMFNFSLTGEGEGQITGSGSFTSGAGGSLSGTENFAEGILMSNNTPIAGVLEMPFDGGRGLATIGSNQFSYYVISPSEIILVGLDEASLIHGTAQKQ
jgi:hypothetical protein